MRSRSFRRYQESKKKSWVRREIEPRLAQIYSYGTSHKTYAMDPAAIGRRAHTPAPCSCYMCGNGRKFWGDSIVDKKEKEKEKHQD